MNYKIFTSPLSIAVLAALVLVYILIALFTRFMPKAKALPMVLGIIGIVLHIAIFAICLLLKATMAEILLIMVASLTIALWATVRKEGK